MRIVHLVPPGRLPTVIIDPGLWWDAISATGRHELIGYSANFHWWQHLCSDAAKAAFLADLSQVQRWRRRLEWRVSELQLDDTAWAAGRALKVLGSTSEGVSATAFLDATKAVTAHLDALNRAQLEIEFSLSPGVRMRNVNYAASQALLHCARNSQLLGRLVAASLDSFPPDVEFLAVSVTSPESLLTAMVAVRLLRARSPRMHCCLADHGYENFSLHAHIQALRKSRALEELFDTIVEVKDDRDALVPDLVERVAARSAPRGFVRVGVEAASVRVFERVPVGRPVPRYSPPPPLPTFTPHPVLFTRLSRRRCYWSRCTFCTQNTKYDDPRAASRLEVPSSLDRLSAYIDRGYRNIIFSDEAISPATLKILSEEIVKRGLKFQWTCRCRLELTHTRELFEQMRAAGCYEILFGLESISPRVQKLMDKHLEGMDEVRVRRIFDDMNAAGLGIHVTMIAGFPGDTKADAQRTVDFAVDALRGAHNATFYLNRFNLFPDTIVLREPDRFGIQRVFAEGDMPSAYGFELNPVTHGETKQVLDSYPDLHEKLVDRLGWKCLGSGVGGAGAELLYFTSGWGAMFKTQPSNPFANPLLQPLASREAAPLV